MDSSLYDIEKFKNDKIRAVDAKFEANKIAFAPLAFQAIKSMINLGILQAIEDSFVTIAKDDYIIGHTGNFLNVKYHGNKNDLNKDIEVKINNIEYPYCIGSTID